MRNEIDEIKRLLVDQIYDLCAPINIMRGYINSESFDPTTNQSLSIFRLCNHGLIISLYKLHEIYKNYGSTIKSMPDEIKLGFKEVHKTITDKKIPQFRSKYVAHIFEETKGEVSKPLSVEKGKELLSKIMGNNIEEMLLFYEWVYPENYSETGQSVVAVVQQVRDYCLSVSVSGSGRS